jgi:hypothetical protein
MRAHGKKVLILARSAKCFVDAGLGTSALSGQKN